MKTFELIKKLPFEGSPEIGYISKPSKKKDGAHYWNHNWFHPENYPEYWKEIKRDYEILSFIRKGSLNYDGAIFSLQNGLYSAGNMQNDLSLEHCLKGGFKIHSVKRLSDGEVFKIGDKTEEGVILDFDAPGESKDFLRYKVNNNGNGWRPFRFTKKSKIAFTLNNVDFYYGETVYGVGLTNFQVFSITICNKNSDIIKSWVHGVFKTQVEAEEYVLLNTPCLSYNNVMNISNNILIIHADKTETKLGFYEKVLRDKVKENIK